MKNLLFVFICFPMILLSQNWIQLGSDIDGEAAGDYFGRLFLSEDGNRLAVGAILNDGNGLDAGHVRVFNWDGATWIQLGQDIDGEAAGDESGFRISLSTDGNIIAIGAKHNDGNGSSSGHVKVFSWDGSTWIQLGQDIDGANQWDQSGSSVSLSSDGSILAVGSQSAANEYGHVRVYSWNGFSWNQLGQDIIGESANDRFGFSASLNNNGDILAVGADQNDGNGINSGHVRVFSWDGINWNQLGQDIDGEDAGDASGWSLSMNNIGNIVAIGALANNENGLNSGHVRVFSWDGINWNQLGQDIDGEATGDQLGASVSISSDGNTLAVGAPKNDNVGIDAGYVRVFSWDGINWNQLGQDIDGEDAGDNNGCSISINGNGSIIATGGYQNNGNGVLAGHVRVFNLNTLGCADSTACNYDLSANTDDGSCIYIDSSNVQYVTACDTYTWNGTTYDSSGTYNYSGSLTINNYSIELDNVDDYLESYSDNTINNLFSSTNAYTVSFWVISDNYDNAQLFDKGYAYSNNSSDATSMQIWSGGNGVLLSNV